MTSFVLTTYKNTNAEQYGLTLEQAGTMTATQIMQWVADKQGQTDLFQEPIKVEPVKPVEVKPVVVEKISTVDKLFERIMLTHIETRMTKADLLHVHTKNKDLHQTEWFMNALKKQKKHLQMLGIITPPPLVSDYSTIPEQGEEVKYYNNPKQLF